MSKSPILAIFLIYSVFDDSADENVCFSALYLIIRAAMKMHGEEQ